MTDRTLRISARMAEEIQQWASDELGMWPRDTAYAADLESLLAQLTAEQPAPDAPRHNRAEYPPLTCNFTPTAQPAPVDVSEAGSCCHQGAVALADESQQPVPAHIAAAACTCGHCGGLVCCQNCGTPPSPAPDAVAEAAKVLLAAMHSDQVQGAVDAMHGMLPVGTARNDAQIGATFFLDALAKGPSA